MIDARQSHAWLVGGGIASLAAATYLIRDIGLPGANIHILEESHRAGGALDGALSSAEKGYVTRGGRMLDEQAYPSLWNLLETIPSIAEPGISVREEINRFNAEVQTYAKARLIGRGAKILDATRYGFDFKSRVAMMRLMLTPEAMLASQRIEEHFPAAFFESRFWRMWQTTFAFQKWHSAAELRRYFLRFAHEFPDLHTLSGVRRTRYNQYDSIIRPLQTWLLDQGVDVQFGARVVDMDFATDAAGSRRATRIHIMEQGRPRTVELGEHDTAFMTVGSITADAAFAGNDAAPELIRDRRDGAWRFWEVIATKADDFGRPSAFFGDIDASKWQSFTLTMHATDLIDRIVQFSSNQPGTGALMTFVDSAWLLSIVVAHQPHFLNMPSGCTTLWGYGLNIDTVGDLVRKPMAQCTGREILTELVHHLGFEDILDQVMATTDVTTAMLPYASAVFSPRTEGDRPLIVPQDAINFAFLGQFCEQPVDVVFTVEYSVHGAMHAVHTLYQPHELPPVRHRMMEPDVAWRALETVFR
ncbi:oleate hydratase [Sphingomonas sp. DBB INV C78]